MSEQLLWPALGGRLLAAGVAWQFLFIALAVLVLRRRAPAEREGLSGSIAVYALGLVGLCIAALLAWRGLEAPAQSLDRVALLVLGIGLIRLGGMVLFRALLPALGSTPARIVEDLCVFGAYVGWGMLRLSTLGVDLGSLLTTSAVITAILAFSLQDTLGNILGGTALQLDDSIRVGDWIRVDDVTGRVVDIRWRSTLLETRNGETVVLPNAMLMRTRFTVLGRRSETLPSCRRWLWFSCDFGIPPHRVMATVETALQRADLPGVARTPAPQCLLMDLAESSARYALRYWLTDLVHDDGTDSMVRSHIDAAFRREGLRFAAPEQTVHVVQEDAEHEIRRYRRELKRRLEILRRTALFAGISEEERQTLAEHLVRAPFLAGETVTRQGDVAHWLYLLHAGEVEVVVDTPAGQRKSLGRIRGDADGEFFGEMGMLTGEPRSASVVAVTDVECYRLDKEAFRQILQARPAIAEEISTIVARRRADLTATQQALDQAARQALLESSRGELVARIRRFFGLERGAPG